jgi:hypothetical protein
MADNRTNQMPEGEQPFGVVCDALSAAMQPYDVVFFPEGDLRPDDPQRQDLRSYATVILPGCSFLTLPQADLLANYLDAGGHALVLGPLGTNLVAQRRERLASHPNVAVGDVTSLALDSIPGGPQLRVTGGGPTDAAATLQTIERGAALHLIRYDEDGDAVAPLNLLELEVRLPFAVTSCEIVDPLGEATLDWKTQGSSVRLRIRDLPLYAIVVFAR